MRSEGWVDAGPEKIREADVIILGSPSILERSPERSVFLERLFFPCSPIPTLAGLSFPESADGFYLHLGATKKLARERRFDKHIAATEALMQMIFGASETLCSYDTYQFEDYSKVYAPCFDPEKRQRLGLRFFRRLRESIPDGR